MPILAAMRIGFDAKRIYHNTTGLGNYSRTLVQGLVRHFPLHDYFLFTPNKQKNVWQPDNTRLTTITGRGSLWRSYGINKDLAKNHIQIYHGLSNEIPVRNSSLKTHMVVTIHDLIFKRFPLHYRLMDRTIYNLKSKYACTHADIIIATSEATKNDIVQFYSVNPDKIKVVYQSCNSVFFESSDSVIDVVKKYNLPSSYLLYVGSITERKNLLGICKAFLQLPNDKRLPFVVIGNGGDYFQEVKKFIAANKLQSYFIFLQNISTPELVGFYKKALAFVYLSLYEGFGIPVLEAMAGGCPVLTSNVSSMPEAGGHAALYANPNNLHDMADKLQQLIDNGDLRKSLSIKGKEQALAFKNDDIVKQVMNIYCAL